MPDNPTRQRIQKWAADLLAELGDGPSESVRVTCAAGGRACLVQVWPAGGRIPTAKAERVPGGRERCRVDVLAVVRAAGRPLTRKEISRAVRAAGHPHGPGTVNKVLADLTRGGLLVNPRDRQGYRLPGWIKERPTLFPM